MIPCPIINDSDELIFKIQIEPISKPAFKMSSHILVPAPARCKQDSRSDNSIRKLFHHIGGIPQKSVNGKAPTFFLKFDDS